MRILLVHQAYPPEASGGSEIYTQALARTLSSRHDVAVLHRSTESAPGLRTSRRDGVRVFSLGGARAAGFEAYRDPGPTAAAEEIFDAFGPEVVHVGSLQGLSTGIVFAARSRGAAVVMTLHDFATVCPLGQLLDRSLRVCAGPGPSRCLGCVGEQLAAGRDVAPLVRRVGPRLPFAAAAGRAAARLRPSAPRRVAERLEEMHEVLRAADVRLSPSRFLAERLAALGAPPVDVLELGLEPRPATPRTPDPDGRVRFGFVGAAIPSKGVHVLAAAFRRLNDPRAVLRVHGAFAPYHGDTGYESRVRALLGPQADEALAGPFPHESLGEVLAGLDVLVVPSLWEENAPLVVAEAFRHRLPLVVSGHGGLAERVREGSGGLQFRPGDPSDLARVLRRLVGEPGLAAAVAAGAPPVPDFDAHTAAIEEAYARARARYRERTGRVGVVVLDCARPDDTARAVASARDPFLPARVVVVENGPGPGGDPALKDGAERLVLPRNLGYAAGMNAGLEHLRRAGCDRVLLLNNDATLDAGCLRRLAEALEEPGVAAAAPVVLREADGRVESRGALFDARTGRQRLLGHGERPGAGEGRIEARSLSGAVWMVSLAALGRLGPLDESFFFSFEDTEWCQRARRAGWRLRVVLGARARHSGSRTIGPASALRLYYAARNHVHAAERVRPCGAAATWARRLAILAMNLGHAASSPQVGRRAAVRAAWRGSRDAWRGQAGPAGGAP
ncbi:MAG: glycosyltransferase [Vicinamibacteria bacterium]